MIVPKEEISQPNIFTLYSVSTVVSYNFFNLKFLLFFFFQEKIMT